MYQLGLVALGGAIGASGRHLVNLLTLRLFGSGFPAGTLAVNVGGGFLMGCLAGFLALRASGGGQSLRLFLGTGILGGFTTFSAFSLDAVSLWQRGDLAAASAYVLASVLFSILALLAGVSLVRMLA
jgi:CrcB protein